MGPGVETAQAFMVVATVPPCYLPVLVARGAAKADSQKIPRTILVRNASE
jgi:hypothetical protein